MAERIADNPELLVDEMKRKARRRLVGAVVLALAAAIILPMLLEKEPRPLGDDVSVQIPPVDQGKFVNRLTGKTGDDKPPSKTDSKAIGVAPGKSETKAETPVETATPASAPPAAAQKAEPMATGAQENKQETKSEAKSEPKAMPKADSKAAAPTEPASEPKSAVASAPSSTSAPAQVASANPSAASPAASPATTSKPDGFVVQLAAFADDKGANALANKLKKGGYAAYVEPVNTSRGTLWRVRVGGYGTRPEAETARVALKGEGYSGIIAPAQ